MFGVVPIIQRTVLSFGFIPQSIKSFLAHPAGPFTIFFWAPTFKWMITISNIGDLEKPAHLISANQQIAIFATGIIWSKYALSVVPKNYNLMIVNVFMALSAGMQLFRKSQIPAE